MISGTNILILYPKVEHSFKVFYNTIITSKILTVVRNALQCDSSIEPAL
jgi:hypothetical protein